MGSDTSHFKQRRRDATANMLVTAAEAVIARNGYEKVTMREIASEAGCTAGTLYTYFKNKHDLLLAIIEKHSASALEIFFAAANHTGTPLERLRNMMQTAVDYAANNRNFFRVLYSGAPIRPLTVMPGLSEHISAKWQELWQIELGIIREAQALGDIRTDFDAESIHAFMHGLGMGIIGSISTEDSPPPKDEQLRTLWGFFTGGIGAKTR